MTSLPDPTQQRQQNRDFWEQRGRSGQGHSVTMMAEHQRFLDYIHRSEVRFLEHRLASFRKPRILDLGCGSGRLALALAPQSSEVIGIELAESLVAQARAAVEAERLGNVRIEQGSVEACLNEGKFDVVILSGVLNHVDDETVTNALREAAGALVPKGMLYIRNNCSNSDIFFRPMGMNQPPCTFRRGEDYRTAVAATPGLEIIEERYLFAPLCIPNLVYYYLLPQPLRDHALVGRALDAWFRYEERTSERRLRRFGRLYPSLVRAIRKPTSFRVVVAVRNPP